MALFDRMRNMTPEKKKKWANALFLLGGGLQDKDITQQAMMLQQMNAMNKAEAGNVAWNKTVDQMALERNRDGTLKYNPNQIAILRTPEGRKAYINLDIQRQFGTPKPSGKLLQVVDSNNNYVRNIPVEEFYTKGLKPGEKLTNLPTGTEPAGSLELSDYKDWSGEDGLKTKHMATRQLVRTGQRLLDNLFEKPKTVLTVGDFAQMYERVKAEVGAIGGRPKDYTKHLVGGKIDKQAAIKELAQGSAKTESMLLDFTFQIAKARGQEGKGLSDRDFEIFQKIISAGLTADQKAAALASFVEGIQLLSLIHI
mgnify:CR=1 FL=1